MGALENNCVLVEIALLEGQAALSGFSIKNYDADTETDKDRIVVTGQPRTGAVVGRDGDVAVNSVQVDVEIILATRSVSALDTYIAAVEAANKGTPAAAAVTLATSLFPDGVKVIPTDDGSREGEGTNARKRTKSFLFIGNEFVPSEFLLESGDALLLEDDSNLLLEA